MCGAVCLAVRDSKVGDGLTTAHVLKFMFNKHVKIGTIINFKEEETEARNFNSLTKDHQLLDIGTRFLTQITWFQILIKHCLPESCQCKKVSRKVLFGDF